MASWVSCWFVGFKMAATRDIPLARPLISGPGSWKSRITMAVLGGSRSLIRMSGTNPSAQRLRFSIQTTGFGSAASTLDSSARCLRSAICGWRVTGSCMPFIPTIGWFVLTFRMHGDRSRIGLGPRKSLVFGQSLFLKLLVKSGFQAAGVWSH